MSYGAFGAVQGTARFASSATVGLVSTVVSPTPGFSLAALLMATGTLVLIRVKRG